METGTASALGKMEELKYGRFRRSGWWIVEGEVDAWKAAEPQKRAGGVLGVVVMVFGRMKWI
jgi:hypothetical protein